MATPLGRLLAQGDSVRRTILTAATSGLVAGVVMGLYLAVVAAVQGRGAHAPFLLIGRTLDPARVPFPMPDALTVILGILLHLITAQFWAMRYRVLCQALPAVRDRLAVALPLGLAWGVLVWLLMGLIVGPALNPAMRLQYPLHYFLAHLLYGVAGALTVAVLGRLDRRSASGDAAANGMANSRHGAERSA